MPFYVLVLNDWVLSVFSKLLVYSDFILHKPALAIYISIKIKEIFEFISIHYTQNFLIILESVLKDWILLLFNCFISSLIKFTNEISFFCFFHQFCFLKKNEYNFCCFLTHNNVLWLYLYKFITSFCFSLIFELDAYFNYSQSFLFSNERP